MTKYEIFHDSQSLVSEIHDTVERMYDQIWIFCSIIIWSL